MQTFIRHVWEMVSFSSLWKMANFVPSHEKESKKLEINY